MEAEELMKIFDHCWFEANIFNTQEQKPSNSAESVVSDCGPGKPNDNLSPMLSRAPTVLVRSMSDQLALQTSFSPSGSVSPDSVLLRPPGGGKLCTIPSGKEYSLEEEEGGGEAISAPTSHLKRKEGRKLARRGRTTSKSLSELEFEEVKGFMDLGFVFSDEDKDSSLAEIIPGLHRLGKSAEEEGEGDKQEQSEAVERPYLSESWEWWERQRKEEERRRRRQLSMQWEVPASSDESDIKRSLRLWAHNVASTVR